MLRTHNQLRGSRILEQSIRPVILSGGSGTRLWPVSRQLLPKQLLAFGSSETLLQATALRTLVPGYLMPIVVTSEGQRFLVQQQLAEIGIAPDVLILEPASRNTAPAIALAAFWQAELDPDQLMLAMPSDHIIGDPRQFQEAVATGMAAAADGAMVTFGLTPSRIETGYGYIQAGVEKPSRPQVRDIVGFVEKPDLETAAQFCSTGDYFWNAGIFLFRAGSFLQELREHAPEVASACEAAFGAASSDGAFLRPDPLTFEKSPSISIDYALMEKTGKGAVVPVDLPWSDVGSWNAVWELSAKDGAGNAVSENVVTVDSDGCLLRTDTDATIAAIGVKDLVVVATRDAILVIPRDRSQQAKLAVDALQDAGIDRASVHTRVDRPWGSYEVMDRGERFQTKRIIVKPGGVLSLQMHHQRAEHWIVVSGTARVTVGREVKLLQENESTFVPAGTVHRLENPGRIPLHLIEVQCGPYLGEDDIVRLEDVYGRAAETQAPES